MTIQEFYSNIEENYEQVLSMYRDDSRIQRFIGIYAKDESFNNLVKFLDENNYPEAFRMAHTLKGIAANLCFEKYRVVASELTELLRDKVYKPGIEEAFAKVKEAHDIIEKNIGLL